MIYLKYLIYKFNFFIFQVLFAAQEFPQLDTLIERRFSEPGDVEQTLELVHRSRALENSNDLARKHGETAIQHVSWINYRRRDTVERDTVSIN